ncbi:MAG: UDP-N-acetylmuramoyl-L-alanine--D-glutamate ligase [Blastochloris viridis]|uniref:UDP-N-acetylmuramoylalanine--D-glutamate ligase n=1 Tax=Blastochloris viridis TaxID=1079 RepID=A0A6N4R8Z2_BLAVI|nr:MAG: UDP-N-acetylmuramoyl-L-alanine--D-glutamate ligase [Blastochloris viridis]
MTMRRDVYGFGHKAVMVYGLGSSGRATALALQDAGVEVFVWDDNDDFNSSPDANLFSVRAPDAVDWTRIGALVKSPGISLETPLVRAALAHKVPVMTDVDLLYRRDNSNGAAFIGITGTNGKSTTTALIGHILRVCGYKVAVGGNIGTPALALPELPKNGVYVLELSSYQLETLTDLQVDGALLLNLTPDHLARHGTMEAYLAAKLRLFDLAKAGAVQVMGIDQPLLRGQAETRGVTTVSVTGVGDYMVTEGKLTHGLDTLMPLEDLEHLPGPHNAQNVACAYALLVPRWCTPAEFRDACKSFKGLPHRLEKVGKVGDVLFVNDSKATNGDSTVYALQSFANIYWICGGLPKTDGLGACINHLGAVRAAFTIGQATEDFADTLVQHNVPSFKCHTMDVAVREAFAAARSEGLEDAVVLLSPSAASMDQYRNFEHRGDTFVNLVQGLVTVEQVERRVTGR